MHSFALFVHLVAWQSVATAPGDISPRTEKWRESMRGSVHEVISLSARFPLCATASWPGIPMLAFHKVRWSRPTLPRLALCATAAWPGGRGEGGREEGREFDPSAGESTWTSPLPSIGHGLHCLPAEDDRNLPSSLSLQKTSCKDVHCAIGTLRPRPAALLRKAPSSSESASSKISSQALRSSKKLQARSRIIIIIIVIVRGSQR